MDLVEIANGHGCWAMRDMLHGTLAVGPDFHPRQAGKDGHPRVFPSPQPVESGPEDPGLSMNLATGFLEYFGGKVGHAEIAGPKGPMGQDVPDRRLFPSPWMLGNGGSV